MERLGLVAKVAQDRVVPAGSALGPADQLEEESPLVLHHRRVGRRPVRTSFDQRAAQREVTGGDEQEAEGVGAVASGPADLLIVGLDRAGRSEVDDGSDVSPVDAHAERVGGDDDLGAAVGKRALCVFSLDRREARVVDTGAPALGLEPRALLLCGAPGWRVHDRRAAPLPMPAERFGKSRVDSPAALALVLDLDRA